MKTLTNIAGAVVLISLLITAQLGFAQQTPDKQEQQKFQIKIVKDENGKKEVIDKTFNNQEELDAYLKDNKMDMPEMNGLPALQEITSSPGSSARADGNKDKKIVISEQVENNADGNTSLAITYQNYSAEERAELIQNILNQKSKDVKVEITKERQVRWTQSEVTQTPEPPKPPSAIKEPAETSANLSEVKVFPNPATGQFNITFNVGKAADIQLRVTDLNGKEVYAEKFINYSGKFEKEIKAANLSTGTYIVEIQTGNEKNSIQVVMQ
jgi:hypothetical protein